MTAERLDSAEAPPTYLCPKHGIQTLVGIRVTRASGKTVDYCIECLTDMLEAHCEHLHPFEAAGRA